MQNKLMTHDPVTGEESPYPSNAAQYREYHGEVAWLFNPWTGLKRDPRDIGSDVLGLLIDTGEPMLASDDAKYKDLLSLLGCQGHAGAVDEINRLRAACGLDDSPAIARLYQEEFDDGFQSLVITDIDGNKWNERRRYSDHKENIYYAVRDANVPPDLLYQVICKISVLVRSTRERDVAEIVPQEVKPLRSPPMTYDEIVAEIKKLFVVRADRSVVDLGDTLRRFLAGGNFCANNAEIKPCRRIGIDDMPPCLVEIKIVSSNGSSIEASFLGISSP